MHDVLTLILGGGRGARLFPLTRRRSEPAVPIAGKYRLIDIPVSNCINSGLHRIYVLTQYLSVSLHRHISNTFKFAPFSPGFVSVLAAQQTNETADWYRGTADAVRQNMLQVEGDQCRDVLILSGDQLYRMDFRDLIRTHRETRADVTLAVAPVGEDRTRDLGVVRVDDGQRVVDLVEKPQTEAQRAGLRLPAGWLQRHGVTAARGDFLANMGIYLFRRDFLLEQLRGHPEDHDFVLDLFLRCLSSHRLQAFLFGGYWEDVGSIGSYFRASLELAGDPPPFDFHSEEGVIFTRMRNLPAAHVNDAVLEQCLVSDGCVVETGSRLERCVLGVRTHVGRGADLREAVILGANFFETEPEAHAAAEQPRLGVGEDSVLRRVLVDKNCRIGRGVRIVNEKGVQEADGEQYFIREGIVVIPHGAVIPDGTVI